jgi:hypothetical protein
MESSRQVKLSFFSDLLTCKVMDLSTAQLAALKIDFNDISNILSLMGVQQDHSKLRTMNDEMLH